MKASRWAVRNAFWVGAVVMIWAGASADAVFIGICVLYAAVILANAMI